MKRRPYFALLAWLALAACARAGSVAPVRLVQCDSWRLGRDVDAAALRAGTGVLRVHVVQHPAAASWGGPTARDRTGTLVQGLVGAQLRLEDERGAFVLAVDAAVVGEWQELGPVPGGRYVLRTSRLGFAADTLRLTIRAGYTDTVEVRLRPGRSIQALDYRPPPCRRAQDSAT